MLYLLVFSREEMEAMFTDIIETFSVPIVYAPLVLEKTSFAQYRQSVMYYDVKWSNTV